MRPMGVIDAQQFNITAPAWVKVRKGHRKKSDYLIELGA